MIYHYVFSCGKTICGFVFDTVLRKSFLKYFVDITTVRFKDDGMLFNIKSYNDHIVKHDEIGIDSKNLN